ncbi:MAG: hypothetical protein WKF86_00490 [Acidimicrobiales bacterium]
MRSRVILFVTICVVATTVAIGYSIAAADRNAPPSRSATAAAAQPEPLAAVTGPYLGYIGTRIDSTGSRFAVAPPGGSPDAPALTDLRCKVAHAAAGRGICLEYGGLVASDLIVFDERFQPLHKVPLPGFLPSRARVASDGKLGAVTVFVNGHSYAVAGFSTFTGIFDLSSGKLLASLEDFKVTRDGKPFSSPDFNFWGVTFAKEQGRFYATLGTGGETYLVEADMGTRTARVLRSNVECPSLSPDGTRLVFKKRVSGGLGPVEWRLHVLDLATMKETPLSETRSIDDQAEWLDDQRVAYSAMRPRPSGETDTWVVPVDGSQQPSILVPDAQSPVAVHQWG